MTMLQASLGHEADTEFDDDAPELSVVIPVYNEQDWIERSVGALLASASAASWPIEVVVVDDGSTDATPSRLDDLRERHGITVLSQANSGRFEARRAGIAKSSGEWVALLDSRVIVDEHTLTFLRDQLVEHPERAVWNGHINVASEHNPYAGFMAGLVKVPWRKYCANPRLMSYGITVRLWDRKSHSRPREARKPRLE